MTYASFYIGLTVIGQWSKVEHNILYVTFGNIFMEHFKTSCISFAKNVIKMCYFTGWIGLPIISRQENQKKTVKNSEKVPI